MAINFGDYSPSVGELQAALGVKIDDDFGPMTARALIGRSEVQQAITHILHGNSLNQPTNDSNHDKPTNEAQVFKFPSPFGAGGTLEMIDIYDGNTFFSDTVPEGLKCIYFKVSEGHTISQPHAAIRAATARLKGLKVGFYHVFSPTSSIADQVAWFMAQLQVVGGLLPTDLPPMIDWETKTFPGYGETPMVEELCTKVETVLKRKVVVYCSLSKPAEVANPEWLLSRWLWIAEYGPTQAPKLEHTKINPENVFAWQYSGTDVDKDKFNGDEQILEQMISASHIKT